MKYKEGIKIFFVISGNFYGVFMVNGIKIFRISRKGKKHILLVPANKTRYGSVALSFAT